MTVETKPIRVKHIDHVTLIVNDLEKSREFYCDVLGMEQVDRPGFSFGGSWFQAGPTQIHLIHEHENSGPAGENTADLKKTSRNRHFAFEIEDGNAAVARLEELNIPLLAGPQTRPDGAIQLFVTDPDGHVVELCSPPVAASE
ncbi:MAG: hypothetical protein Tsb009_16100 [Planctomycetaceae bacterium]